MPIHIDDRRGERDTLILETIHQFQVFRLRVTVVATPPVAKRIARQQRGRSSQRIEVLHSFDVTTPVSEEIDVGFRMISWPNPSAERIRLAVDLIGLDDDVRSGIIDHSPTVT